MCSSRHFKASSARLDHHFVRLLCSLRLLHDAARLAPVALPHACTYCVAQFSSSQCVLLPLPQLSQLRPILAGMCQLEFRILQLLPQQQLLPQVLLDLLLVQANLRHELVLLESLPFERGIVSYLAVLFVGFGFPILDFLGEQVLLDVVGLSLLAGVVVAGDGEVVSCYVEECGAVASVDSAAGVATGELVEELVLDEGLEELPEWRRLS